MKLNRINKYILDFIFNHLTEAKRLNSIRYNKKMQAKLNISLYNYQKKYFEKIITPALLKNSEIFIQNNIYDKETLNKLKLDWEKELTEIIQGKDCFHFNQKINKKNLNENKYLNISLKEQNFIEKSFPNLIELNISDIANLKLPCLILENLETLSLQDIYKLKFLNKEKIISLNKLKHFYLNNISFHEENEIKIKFNNLKYLDIRLKELESSFENIDIHTDFDNHGNKAGFTKEKTLENLINIFDFKFLSIFKFDENKFRDEREKFKGLQIALKKPEELFDAINSYKYDFFNLEINYEYYRDYYFSEYFIYKYLFAKTKGNKYLFQTEYTNYDYEYDKSYEAYKEKRLCNIANYDDYYFIDNEAEIGGDSQYKLGQYIDLEKANKINIVPHEGRYNPRLIYILEKFEKNNNKIEIISVEDLNLDLIRLRRILEKFQNLKCFYVTKKCTFKNKKQLIELFNKLSKINSLYLIEITVEGELELTKNEKKIINDIFPGISFTSIKKGKNESYIKWINGNYKLNI